MTICNSRVITWMIPIVFLAMGVVRLPNSDTYTSMLVSMELGVAAIVAIATWRVNLWVAIFLLTGIFCSYFPVLNVQSYLARQALITGTTLYCLVYYITYFYGDEPFLNGIRLVAIANILLMGLQMLHIDPFFNHASGEFFMEGFNAQRNVQGMFLALSLPAFIGGVWVWFLPFLIYGIVAQMTFAPVACMCAVAVYMLVSRGGVKTGVAFMFLLSVLVLLFWAYIDSPGLERFGIWRDGVLILLKRLDGFGLGQWKMVTYGLPMGGFKTWSSTADNNYLQVVFEMGIKIIPVIVTYLTFVAIRLKNVCAYVRIGVLLVLTGAFINSIFNYAPTAILSIVWLAIFEAKRIEV